MLCLILTNKIPHQTLHFIKDINLTKFCNQVNPIQKIIINNLKQLKFGKLLFFQQSCIKNLNFILNKIFWFDYFKQIRKWYNFLNIITRKCSLFNKKSFYFVFCSTNQCSLFTIFWGLYLNSNIDRKLSKILMINFTLCCIQAITLLADFQLS